LLIRQLEEQLHITHEQLQATTEQLETSNEGFLSTSEELMSINEEFQSANEELQSTNEELETSKEELQALNEELVTVNSELQGKVEELNQATGNMENLLTSSEIATIFLDQRLNLKGFTPAAAAVFNLIPSDAGRPFRHFAGRIDWPGFSSDAETVLAGQPFTEREVTTLDSERCYLKRLFPYRTPEGKIDGIVVTLIDITEKKQNELAILRAKQEWERTFDSVPDLIAVMDAQHRIIRVNKAMAGRLGVTPDECIGRACFMDMHGADGPHKQCPHSMTLADGQEHVAEVHEERLGGDFLVTTTPLMDEHGLMIGTVHVARDITERKRAEEALRKSEEMYRSLFSNMLNGFAYCRMMFEEGAPRDFVYLAVNDAFEKQTGLRDVVGRRVTEVIPGIRETDPTLFEIYGRVALTGIPERIETYVAALREWFSISVYSPAQEHFVVVFDVITERKKAEEEQSRLAAIVESSDDAIIGKDQNGVITSWNGGAERLFGYQAEEIVGRNVTLLIPPELQAEEETLQQRLMAGQRIDHYETVRLANDGRRIEVSLSVSPIKDSDGRIIGASKIARDISDRKQGEAYRSMGRDILQVLNENESQKEAIKRVIDIIKSATGVDAVGIRLQDEDDFPYFYQEGFPQDFLLKENSLLTRTKDGGICRDECGDVCLECTCGLVVTGKTDPSSPLFTKGGSSWTNDSFPFLDVPADDDIRTNPRNECIHQGYASVALIPIRAKGRVVGLLQLNDRRKGCFTLEGIEALEKIAENVGEAMLRKQAEEALRESERCERERAEELAVLFEAVPTPVFIARDPDCLNLTGNRLANELLRISPGKELSLSGPTETRPRHFRAFKDGRELRLDELPAQRSARGVPVNDFEFSLVFDDGSVRHVLGYGTPLLDKQGGPRGTVTVLVDITERKRAEEELVKLARQRQLALDAAHMGWWHYDPITKISSWDDGYKEIFCITGHKSPNEEILARIHPDDLPGVWAKVEAALDPADPQPYVAEYRINLPDGNMRWIKAYGVASFEGEGDDRHATSFVGTVADISEHKRAEEELQRSKEAAEEGNRVKSQFLANMSHELRTPMTGVLGMLDLALSGNLEAEQREFICAAHASAHSLIRIINDILDLTKIEKGILSIVEEPFSIRKCVENTFNILLPVAKRKGLELSFTVADDIPETVSGDQTRLNQILTNLAGNAVKFTEKGKAEIRVTAGGSVPEGRRAITFTVTDTGIGIPEGKKDLLFREFSQVDDSHSRAYGGTGLGLAISKEIVERLGGKITFTSEVGKGSAFSFCIPFGEADTVRAIAANPEKTAATKAAPPSEDQNRPRLLLAEDDQTIRQMLQVMLQRSNYEIDIAGNGQEAVEMWESGDYDLILMDVQMPGMNGFEATAAIRGKESSRKGHIPIIAMTAHSLKEDENRCLAAGMDAYISKPIDFKVCRHLIDETLKKFGVIGV
jgi:PAS domain S-box-containing protein